MSKSTITPTRDPKKVNRALRNLQPKKNNEVSMFICEFFEGMELLQATGKSSGENIIGIYFSGKRIGTMYLGEKFTQAQAARIGNEVLPPHWNDIEAFATQFDEKYRYHKYEPEKYSWIYEQIATR